MSLPDGAASIWCQALRISVLDVNGYVDPGANTYTTSQMIKATLTPVTATGDDIEVKNANGDLVTFAKHGDIPKYYTVSLELGTPDPALEQICCGGTLLSSTAAALGTPTGLTVTPQITLGSLVAGTYGYRATQYNAFGESTAANDVSATIASGIAGTNVISGVVMGVGAIGVRIYGRTIGGEQLIGAYPNIGTQATSAASGTGSPASLPVTALTQSIPPGTTFQITGDTNTTKIVFTTTAFAPQGAVTLPVSVSQSITTTIAAGAIVPVFVDTGTVTPSGNIPQTDQTAGPGVAGYAAPNLGVVASPNGVSMEFFEKAIVGGVQASDKPYWWIVAPRVANMHIMARDLTNANTQTVMEGQGEQNPNWGSGPFGTWPFASTQVTQRMRCGSAVVPVAGFTAVPATV
ncbi:MAG TPA: hypothetical protein VG275_06970 [Solirubrobacteraceae bacterium]|jgi:hypothetical protein|nr:hypothetical protein [Solirubrobacteraceae bacterium]